MARYLFVAHANALEGRDDEFNEWYWNHHYKDILAVPGVVSGQRYIPAAAQFGISPNPFKYLAIFELDVDDPQVFINEMNARAASQRMSRSTAVASGYSVVMWQVQPPPS